MHALTLKAFLDELEKIAKFDIMTGKFLPEVGEKLVGKARAEMLGKGRQVLQAPAAAAKKFIPRRGAVPPPLPTRAQHVERLLADPTHGPKLQQAFAGSGQDPRHALSAALAGTGGRTPLKAVEHATSMGQLSSNIAAKAEAPNPMLLHAEQEAAKRKAFTERMAKRAPTPAAPAPAPAPTAPTKSGIFQRVRSMFGTGGQTAAAG